MKKILVIVLALIMVLSMVACSSTAGTTPTKAAASAASAPASAAATKAATVSNVPDEVTIGFVAGLSGDNAQAGQFKKDAWKVIQKELEATKGCITIMGKQVKLNVVFEDTESKADICANAYRKCIDDYKVIAIVGPDESSMTLAGAPIAQQAGVPVVSTFATNIAVTQVGNYIFRACFLDPFQGKVAANYAKNELKVTKAAVLYSNADAYSKGLAEAFIENFKSAGGSIVATETYAGAEVKDFNAQLTNIYKAQPEVLFLPNQIGELPLQIQQARQMGIKATFMGGDSWDVTTLVDVTGKELIEGACFVSCFSPESTLPACVTWVKAFEEINKYRPGAHATLAYEALHIVMNALSQIKTFDKAALRDAIAATKLDLPSGTVTFDANRNPTKAAVVLKYTNGVGKYVTTVNP